jgi:diguanylate cyclase (GGDEF)-like protein
MTGMREGPADGVAGDAVALTAARRLLRVDTRAEAAQVLQAALRELGGQVVEARAAGPEALRHDVSLGVGEPVVVVPPGDSDLARVRLERQLPALLDDARAAAARCDHLQRQATRARTDALTGLADRGEVDHRLAEAVADDVVCLLDLDGFKAVNDTLGHQAGDRALRRFGRLLRESVRDVDFVGRYGGDEFLVVFAATPLPVVEQRMGDLVRRWAEAGSGIGVSIGIAKVGARGAEAAAAAADRALYRAKGAGGAQVRVSTEPAGIDGVDAQDGADAEDGPDGAVGG